MKDNDTKPRVLIVDDEEPVRIVVEKTLRARGYVWEGAANGLEGLEKARKARFDLVLTDLKMPVLDGLTMIEALHREQPGLPIIIMTGYGELDSARRAIQLGVADYLVKPFDDLDEIVVAAGRAIAEGKERAEADAMIDELERSARSSEREKTSLREQIENTKGVLRKSLAEIGHTDIVADEHVARLVSLIAGERDGLLITDASARVVAANSELLRCLDAPTWKGAGLPLSRMPGDGQLREAMEELACSAAAGIDTEVQTLGGVGSDGETVAYELSSAPVRDEEGTIIGACIRIKRCTEKSVLRG